MTLRTLLHDLLGYDAIYVQSVIVVLVGVAVEVGLFFLYAALGGPPKIGMDGETLVSLTVVAVYFCVTMSLGYGLIFALCRARVLRPARVRAIALATVPLGAVGVAVVLALVTLGLPAVPLIFTIVTVGAYAVLVLPLMAAIQLAARTINKTRVNAEAVFGGPP